VGFEPAISCILPAVLTTTLWASTRWYCRSPKPGLYSESTCSALLGRITWRLVSDIRRGPAAPRAPAPLGSLGFPGPRHRSPGPGRSITGKMAPRQFWSGPDWQWRMTEARSRNIYRLLLASWPVEVQFIAWVRRGSLRAGNWARVGNWNFHSSCGDQCLWHGPVPWELRARLPGS
jgi:hypothetical protein